MRPRLSSLAALVAALALPIASATISALSWPQQVAARDAPAQPTSGTATITGTLVSDDAAAQPIRRATVSLSGLEFRRSLMLSTNDQGQFAFANLPAGHYTLSATRPGYAVAIYGARQSWKLPGTSIVLADGQQMAVTLRMMHGGVIAGTITDAFGRPQPGVRIMMLRFRTIAGERQADVAPVAASGTTDDLGGYRVFGLPPGDYGIGASVFSGPETRQVTDAEIQWAQQQLRGGPPTIGLTPPVNAPASIPVSYAPVFYPGTTDVSGATVITLGPGEVRAGTDFPLQWVRTSRIEGTVVDVDGRPATAVILNLIAQRTIPPLTPFGGSSSRTDNSGKFSLANVLPGAYTLMARAQTGPTPPAGAGGPATRPLLWAQQDVSVSGTDLTGLALHLQPGLGVTGRVAFDGTTTPPADLTRIRITLAPAQSGGTSMLLGDVQMSADGTFSFQGATPGRYRVNATVPTGAGGRSAGAAVANTPTWTLKSVIYNGVDTLDSALEISTTDLSGVVVTFTDHPTELSGTLVDSSGHPTPEYWVVAFTSNRAYWAQTGRRLRTARPDASGKFQIAGLPPGEYCLIAITDLDQADLADPAFLEQLAAASVKITLADGEKKKQDLKLNGGSPD